MSGQGRRIGLEPDHDVARAHRQDDLDRHLGREVIAAEQQATPAGPVVALPLLLILGEVVSRRRIRRGQILYPAAGLGWRGLHQPSDLLRVGQEPTQHRAHLVPAHRVGQAEVAQESAQMVDRTVFEMACDGAAQAQRPVDHQRCRGNDRDRLVVDLPGQRPVRQPGQGPTDRVPLGVRCPVGGVQQVRRRRDRRRWSEGRECVQQFERGQRQLGDSIADRRRLTQPGREVVQPAQRRTPHGVRTELQDRGQLLRRAAGEPVNQRHGVRHGIH